MANRAPLTRPDGNTSQATSHEESQSECGQRNLGDTHGTQAVVRKFNLEGPVVAERHYCIPPLSRVNLEQILELIADMRYFVLRAPRQTGKTSILLALQDRLNAEGKYRCLYVNFEGG